MLKKIKRSYIKYKIKKFNELMKNNKHSFLNLNDLFQDNSYLKKLLEDSVLKEHYDIDYIIRKDSIDIVLCDYYYHTHPEGAWLILGTIKNNSVYVNNNDYYLNRVYNLLVKNYESIVSNLNEDIINDFEMHSLMNYK